MPQTAEAKAATEARAKEQEEARAAAAEAAKAEEEAAAKAAESGETKFIVSASGMASEADALDAFDAFVNEFESVEGSIVVGGISHDASEFKEEEEETAPAPTQLPAKTSTAEVKK